MRIAAVTVNYCCAEAIVEHMGSTAEEIASSDGEWWIVDNNSPDGSLELLRAALGRFNNTHLIVAQRNGGFGYGNNEIIRRVINGEIDADYLYFLNPDASPQPGSIQAMVSYLEAHKKVGVIGSGLLNQDGTHTDSMFRFPSFWSEIDTALSFGPVSRLLKRYRQSIEPPRGPTAVDWVAGTSFMVRAEVFRTVGGFDEEFFLYWEEVELCHRIKKAGFEIYGLPSAKVVHIGGVSTGMHRPDKPVPAYWHVSRNLYFRKTRTGGPRVLLNMATTACLFARRCLDFLSGRTSTNPHFLRDHVKHAIKDAR